MFFSHNKLPRAFTFLLRICTDITRNLIVLKLFCFCFMVLKLSNSLYTFLNRDVEEVNKTEKKLVLLILLW